MLLTPAPHLCVMPSLPPPPKVWRASSGHVLVAAHVGGAPAGYMMLDTGASGFVITPQAAQDLALQSFGDLYAASVSGKVGGGCLLACRPGWLVGWSVSQCFSLSGTALGCVWGGQVV